MWLEHNCAQRRLLSIFLLTISSFIFTLSLGLSTSYHGKAMGLLLVSMPCLPFKCHVTLGRYLTSLRAYVLTLTLVLKMKQYQYSVPHKDVKMNPICREGWEESLLLLMCLGHSGCSGYFLNDEWLESYWFCSPWRHGGDGCANLRGDEPETDTVIFYWRAFILSVFHCCAIL